MAWRLDGTYFENCNCEVGCPCTVADFSAPADHERCLFLMSFHVDSGKIDDVDVSGLTVGVFGDTPAMMVEGSWKVGLFMDAKASEQQGAKLAGVLSGQMGGPMAGLVPLISEMLGMESASIEYRNDGRHHSVKIGDGVSIEIDDIASPLDPSADADRSASPGRLIADRRSRDGFARLGIRLRDQLDRQERVLSAILVGGVATSRTIWRLTPQAAVLLITAAIAWVTIITWSQQGGPMTGTMDRKSVV